MVSSDGEDEGVDLGFTLAGDDSEEEEKGGAGEDKAAILKRHRVEEQRIRAEAKQALHRVAKGDKPGRAQAEADRDAALAAMRERHAVELGEDPAAAAAAGVAALSVGGQGGGGKKKSKSQKKEEAERAREERIAAHHAGAGPSERDVEIKKLDSQLAPLGLSLHEIPADGHCLYRSIAHHLQLQGDAGCDFLSCRKQIASHMRAHPNDFVPFLAESGATDLTAYTTTVESSNEWGGQMEITALAHARRACVTVYSADAPPLRTGEEYAAAGGPTIELDYHRHYYGLGEHYNAVVSK